MPLYICNDLLRPLHNRISCQHCNVSICRYVHCRNTIYSSQVQDIQVTFYKYSHIIINYNFVIFSPDLLKCRCGFVMLCKLYVPWLNKQFTKIVLIIQKKYLLSKRIGEDLSTLKVISVFLSS